MSTPSLPAAMRGSSSRDTQRWNNQYPVRERALEVKQLSFVAGKYPISTVARADV
jgi:hypothetical protein